jgi:hypothetical protein
LTQSLIIITAGARQAEYLYLSLKSLVANFRRQCPKVMKTDA